MISWDFSSQIVIENIEWRKQKWSLSTTVLNNCSQNSYELIKFTYSAVISSKYALYAAWKKNYRERREILEFDFASNEVNKTKNNNNYNNIAQRPTK